MKTNLSRPLIRPFALLGISVVISATAWGQAQQAQCMKVTFDCTQHKVSIEGGWTPTGNDAKIDCGKNTDVPGAVDSVTYPGVGTIGSSIATTGNAVSGGLDIRGIDGMGTCGGTMAGGVNQASIIHTIPSGASPSGGNKSAGCLRVSDAVMKYISMHCIQAKLEIKTSGKAAPAPHNCTDGGAPGGGSESGFGNGGDVLPWLQ